MSVHGTVGLISPAPGLSGLQCSCTYLSVAGGDTSEAVRLAELRREALCLAERVLLAGFPARECEYP